MPKRYFDEIEIGETFETPGITVTDWHVLQFAGVSMDFFELHTNDEFARQTEFGRRAYENSALGTDHGSGSVMLLLGGGLRGGRVHGRWPGLSKDALHEESDLAVTTDYRDVLAEVLVRRCGNPRVDAVFPGLVHRPIGVCD